MFFNGSSSKTNHNWMVRLTSGLILTMACQTASAGHHGSNLSVNNACVPKRATYGYYETSWRRWSTDSTSTLTSRPTGSQGKPRDLPVVETPKASEEGESLPSSPRSGSLPPGAHSILHSPAPQRQPAIPSQPPIPDESSIEPIPTNDILESPPAPNSSPVLFQSSRAPTQDHAAMAIVSDHRETFPRRSAAEVTASDLDGIVPNSNAMATSMATSDADLVVTMDWPKTAAPADVATASGPSVEPPARAANSTPLPRANQRVANVAPPAPLRSPLKRRGPRRLDTIQAVSAMQILTSGGANPLRSTEEEVSPVNPLR